MFTNYSELTDFIEKNEIKMLDFKIPELTGNWRHLTVPAASITEDLFKEGFGFDGSNYGYKSVETSDMVFIPDFTTAFMDPFWEKPTLSFLGNIHEFTEEGEKQYINDSRVILERALKYMKDQDIADNFILGPEYEYYVLNNISYWNKAHTSGFLVDSQQAHWHNGDNNHNTGYKVKTKDGYHIAAPYDMNRDLRSEICLAIENLGINVKYHHHEVGGPGQHEIEVKRDSAEMMGDATMLIKYFIKNLAYARGKTATFMPKPLFGEAGNGFHVHMQLFKDNKSLFAGPEKNYAGLSDTAMKFMGGILAHTPALMALTAPTTNSYKRLVKGYEAPVAICFATSNRSAVIRIPGYATADKDKRFEFRPGDASGNPYLTFAALLMAGIDGIKNNIDPEKNGFGPLEENVYKLTAKESKKLKFLPSNLDSALTALEKDSKFLQKGNIFTEELINNWIYLKRNELNEIARYPTPREFELYYDV